MVDAVIAVYLTNQRAGSPPGLVVAGPQGGKYYQENCRKKMGPNCVSTMHQNWLQPSLEGYPSAKITRVMICILLTTNW